MKSKVLAVLLKISILGNIYLFFSAQPTQKDLQELENRTNYLEKANADLSKQVVEEGSLINMSGEIRPGEGRVFVQTRPLMGTVFQDAANTAVYVAQNKTGMQLSGSDVIFSIESGKEIPSVDGPSAGALMTLLVISAGELVQYNETRRSIAGMTIIQQVPETIGARQYIETNVGIKIEYVDSIDDVLKYAT